MILASFLFCGLLYSIYTFEKIFSDFQKFVELFEMQFGDTENLNFFLGMLFLNCLFAWPVLAVQEINNKQDL